MISATEYAAQVERRFARAGKTGYAQTIQNRLFRMDADGDGNLSSEERSGQAARKPGLVTVMKMDADEDGRLSPDEFAALVKRREARDGKIRDAAAITEQFSRKDSDADGFISEAEFSAKPEVNGKEAAFMMYDTDGRPGLTPGEYKQLMKARFKRSGRTDSAHAAIQQFANRDTNRDGVLSKAEYMAPPSSGQVPDAGGAEENPPLPERPLN
jgi:Ca2+-binding EF-hand superfamily protein